MSSNEDELKNALNRLEASVQKILNTRGYSKDAKHLKLLQELIREQLTNANTRHPTRALR
jgi:hypothetical protein